jgi:hypothetical protein
MKRSQMPQFPKAAAQQDCEVALSVSRATFGMFCCLFRLVARETLVDNTGKRCRFSFWCMFLSANNGSPWRTGSRPQVKPVGVLRRDMR